MITEKDARYRQDFYEILQLTSNVGESFDRAYRILARQYHPGNQQTGDPARFVQIIRAGKTLSEPKRFEVGSPIRCSVNAANVVLYVQTESHLYAIQKKGN